MAGTFPILIELDPETPIKTLGILNRLPGVAKIHMNLDGFDRQKITSAHAKEQLLLPSPTPEKPVRGVSDFKPSTAVLDLLFAKGEPVHRKEIKRLGGEYGERMVSNIASMVKAGLVKKTAAATYAITAKGHNERNARTDRAPGGAPANEAEKSKETGGDLIMGLLRAANVVTRKQMAEAFAKEGRSKTSVGDQLDKLIKTKKVKHTTEGGRGAYTLA